MRRPRVLHHAVVGLVALVALAATACDGGSPAPSSTSDRSAAPSPSSSPGRSTSRVPSGWLPVRDADTAVWFSLPEQPVVRTTDRVTESGAHLVAHQYEAFHSISAFSQPMAVIVTPFSLSGGTYADAGTVFRGMRDRLATDGAHRARLSTLRAVRIDGRRGHRTTLRFTTKDRSAQGYWVLGHLTRPGFALLVQVQVSAPRLTAELTSAGDRMLSDVLSSIRLPGGD